MATIPQQILDALPTPAHAADVLAWAPIGAAPGTSMGETHIVVTQYTTFVLSRPTPWAALKPMALAPGASLQIASEGFETWLVVPTADGGDSRVPLTAFDREALDKALEAGGTITTAQPDPEPEPEPDPEPEVATTIVEPVVEEPPPATAPGPEGTGSGLSDQLDQALDDIQLAACRAALKGLGSLDVEATVANLRVKVHYDRATLARLADAAADD